MADRITEILTKHIGDLQKSVERMESGLLRTNTNNEDTTLESIAQSQMWIADLEAALEFHRSHNA